MFSAALVLCVTNKMRSRQRFSAYPLVKMRYLLRKPLWFYIISIFAVSNNNVKPQVYLRQDEESQNLLCTIS